MTLNPSSSPLEDVSPATSADSLTAEYTVGVDLGQSFDPTAVAVVRKLHGGSDRPLFQIGHLERLPLQTPYPGVVAHVGRLLARLRGSAELVIDYTGVGRPVFDLFQVAGMSPIGVSIVAGDATTREGLIYKVPKLVLISRVQALLHAGQLKIHKGLFDAPALVEELQSFRAQVTDLGYWRFGARSGKHDDLVLATAIALWRSHGDAMTGKGVFEYYRQQATGGGGGIDREPTPWPAPQTAPADQVLRAPAGVSAAYGLTGRMYAVDARGCVAVTAEDAKPLLANGWTRVVVDLARGAVNS